MIYDREEYEDLTHEKEMMQNKIREMELEHRRNLERAENAAALKVMENHGEYEEKLRGLQEEISALKKEADSERHKNGNLIRILKEKSNAGRGLTPKKEHCGYVFLSGEEFTYIHKHSFNEYSRDNETLPLPCWRVRFQTPYSVEMDFKSVTGLVFDDLINKIGVPMGLKSVRNISNQTISTVKGWLEIPGNFIFKTSYRANGVKGFWEAEYLIKNMISVLPEMLKIQKIKNEGWE